MSETGSEPGATSPAGDTSGPGWRSMRWVFVAAPAAAFVLGLLLGGLVIGVGSGGDAEPSVTETVTASPSVTASADTEVRVPVECVEAAETAQEATQLILDNLTAFQDFRGDQIIDVLDRLEELSRESNELARNCRDIEVSDAGDEPSGSPTPSS